jgi:acyl carrier protein
MLTPDVIRNKVQGLIENTALVSFEGEGIDGGTNLFQAGVLDSFGLIEIISQLEAEFAIKLTDDDMLSPNLVMLDGICAIISSRIAEK